MADLSQCIGSLTGSVAVPAGEKPLKDPPIDTRAPHPPPVFGLVAGAEPVSHMHRGLGVFHLQLVSGTWPQTRRVTTRLMGSMERNNQVRQTVPHLRLPVFLLAPPVLPSIPDLTSHGTSGERTGEGGEFGLGLIPSAFSTNRRTAGKRGILSAN
ncbi:unnamed protein product [Pleuronectes platessa]|uniref:Uncharacterized protein n=1 Tax=Pleuronectes platessa TaxID=8262 RepID=A0A9N7YMB3_PLEPL|nr:unnamed protein product [Pleuronectes platessa]